MERVIHSARPTPKAAATTATAHRVISARFASALAAALLSFISSTWKSAKAYRVFM